MIKKFAMSATVTKIISFFKFQFRIAIGWKEWIHSTGKSQVKLQRWWHLNSIVLFSCWHRIPPTRTEISVHFLNWHPTLTLNLSQSLVSRPNYLLQPSAPIIGEYCLTSQSGNNNFSAACVWKSVRQIDLFSVKRETTFPWPNCTRLNGLAAIDARNECSWRHASLLTALGPSVTSTSQLVVESLRFSNRNIWAGKTLND